MIDLIKIVEMLSKKAWFSVSEYDIRNHWNQLPENIKRLWLNFLSMEEDYFRYYKDASELDLQILGIIADAYADCDRAVAADLLRYCAQEKKFPEAEVIEVPTQTSSCFHFKLGVNITGKLVRSYQRPFDSRLCSSFEEEQSFRSKHWNVHRPIIYDSDMVFMKWKWVFGPKNINWDIDPSNYLPLYLFGSSLECYAKYQSSRSKDILMAYWTDNPVLKSPISVIPTFPFLPYPQTPYVGVAAEHVLNNVKIAEWLPGCYDTGCSSSVFAYIYLILAQEFAQGAFTHKEP